MSDYCDDNPLKSSSRGCKERKPSVSSSPSSKPRAPSSRRPPMSPMVTPQQRANGKTASSESVKETLHALGPPPPPPPPPPGHSPIFSRPMTKTSPNRPRAPSWILEGEKENGDDPDFKEKQKAKFMVEAIRTVLRDTDAMKPLIKYLHDHLEDIFTNGQKAPKADDVRHIIVMAWIEELLRFLVIKVMSNDVLSPCKLGSSPPIDAAWKGLTQFPSAYRKVCRKLGLKSGVIENDLYINEDGEDSDTAHKKRRFTVTTRAYQHCFYQSPPDLYWPEPMEPVEAEDILTMINKNVGSLNVSDLVPESIIKDLKEYDPQVFYEKTTKIFQNGCKIEADGDDDDDEIERCGGGGDRCERG